MARASGRESGSAGVRAKIDQRYYYVQSLRAKIPPGRELNKDAGRRTGAEEAASGDDVAGFQGQDERWLRNYNIHSVERKVNVSCSFNPKSQLCYTCLGEPHRAWEGKGKEPVVVAISDEFFPANIPGMDRGDCIRVIRVEEGTLQDVSRELLGMVKGWQVVPGTVFLLGSIGQLAKVGTEYYTQEWCRCREWIRRELGEVMALPLLPLVTKEVVGENVTRPLLEFLSWFNDLDDSEAGFLKGVRRQYCSEFLRMEGDGVGGADGDSLRNLMLPVDLHGEGLTRYKSRGWGRIPEGLKAVDEDMEKILIGKLILGLSLEMKLSLATTVASVRTLSAVRELEEGEKGMRIRVAGAANAAMTVAALTKKGVEASKVGGRGWNLSIEGDVEKALEGLRVPEVEKDILVFYCLDNSSVFSMDRAGGSSLPKKVGKAYHIEGRLVVVTGFTLEMLVESMLKIVKAARPALTIIVTPMPRYLEPCCGPHRGKKTEAEMVVDQERIMKSVRNMKREVNQLLGRAHARNMIVVSPMEILGVKDEVERIKEVMRDGVHLSEESLDILVDSLLKKAEEHLVARKRGPTEKAGPADKRARAASECGKTGWGDSGGRRGRGKWGSGGGRGGYGGQRDGGRDGCSRSSY